MNEYSIIIELAKSAYARNEIIRFGTLASYLEDNGIKMTGTTSQARNRGVASKVRAAYNQCSNQYEKDAILSVFKDINFSEAY